MVPVPGAKVRYNGQRVGDREVPGESLRHREGGDGMAVLPGMMQTIAGTGEKGYAGDGGPALSALLNEPFMCAFDTQGNLYVAEAINHCVRRIDYRTGV